MVDSPSPFDGWRSRDWIALLVCVGLGFSVTETVDQALRPSLGFWPAFGIKSAAGAVAAFVALAIWGRLIRPRL